MTILIQSIKVALGKKKNSDSVSAVHKTTDNLRVNKSVSVLTNA